MKNTLLILLIAALAAVFTNPDIKEHKETINTEFKEKHKVAGLLGAGKIASELVQYQDYKLASITKFDDKPVSIGLFTKVFVLDDISVLPE